MFPEPTGRFVAAVVEAMAQPRAASTPTTAGSAHRLWRVEEPGPRPLPALLGGIKAYIADGHHRYATALRYRDAKGPDGAWTLGYFTPMEAPGLLVQPYHRILSEGPSLEDAATRLVARRSA